MNKQEQRIAIAEACGWHSSTCDINNALQEIEGKWWALTLPDYLNDLNAMHKAEKVLDQMQARTYADHLADSEQDGTWAGCHMWSQTAAQRAEAFLRCINKWID